MIKLIEILIDYQNQDSRISWKGVVRTNVEGGA